FSHTIGRPRIERSRFRLRHRLHLTIEFRRRSLVNLCLLLETEDAHRFQYSQCSYSIGVGHIFRFLEAHVHMTHRTQIVDLIRPHLLSDAYNIRRICKIAVMTYHAKILLMGILVEMIHTLSIDERGPSFYAMHFISF